MDRFIYLLSKCICAKNFPLILSLVILCFVSLSYAAPYPLGKARTPREKGCYYLLKHYRNGQQIETNEPCLNCTCVNSVLMCYLRVCPFVKPIGVGCTVRKVDGECCPEIICPDGADPEQAMIGEDPDPEPSTTTSTTTTTTPQPTTLANFEGPGCYINNKYYPEGAQIPSEYKKKCEVCYCIRNASACVMQECALTVPGCLPVYSKQDCCPSRYNCSEEAATTAPPETRHPLDEPHGCTLNGKYYKDGEALASSNPCEHCYCMRNEIVCAVQRCKAPCSGCIPIKSDKDKCCPERYECFAGTELVPPINLITADPKSVEKSTEKPINISGVLDGKSTKTPTSTRIPKNETWIAVEVKEETVASSTVSPPPSSSPSYSRRPDEQPSQPRKENDPPMIHRPTVIPSSDRKDTRKDSRRPVPTPGMIPGEGVCRSMGKIYQNGDEIPSSDPCVEYCICINSVIYCDEIICEPPRSDPSLECVPKKLPDKCCEEYICHKISSGDSQKSTPIIIPSTQNITTTTTFTAFTTEKTIVSTTTVGSITTDTSKTQTSADTKRPTSTISSETTDGVSTESVKKQDTGAEMITSPSVPESPSITEKVTTASQIGEQDTSVVDVSVDMKTTPISSSISSSSRVTEASTSVTDSGTKVPQVTREQDSSISSEDTDSNISQLSTSTEGYSVTEVPTIVSTADVSSTVRDTIRDETSTGIPKDYGSTGASISLPDDTTTIASINVGKVSSPQTVESSSPILVESNTTSIPEISSVTEITDEMRTTSGIVGQRDTTPTDVTVDVKASSPSSSTASSIVTQASTSEQDSEVTVPQVTREQDSEKSSEATSSDFPHPPTSTEGYSVTEVGTSVSTTASSSTVKETIRDDSGEATTPQEIETSSPIPIESKTTMKHEISSVTERVTTSPQTTEERFTSTENVAIDVRASSPSSSTVSSMVTEDSTSGPDLETTVSQVIREQDSTTSSKATSSEVSQPPTSTEGYSVPEIATRTSSTTESSTSRETIRDEVTSSAIPKDYGSTEAPVSSSDYTTTIAPIDAEKSSPPQDVETSSPVAIESITKGPEPVSDTTVSQDILEQNVTTPEEREGETSPASSSTTLFSVSKTSTFISTEAPSATVKDVETTTFFSREDASTESPKSSSPVMITSARPDDEQFTSPVNVLPETSSSDSIPTSTDQILRRNETRTESTTPQSDLTTSPSPSIITIPFDSDSVTTQSPTVRETVRIVDITTIVMEENVTSEVPVSSSTSLPTSMPASQDDGSSVSIGGDPTTIKLFPQSTDQTIVPNETIPESTTSVPVPTSPPTTSIFTTVVSLVTDFVSGVTSGPPLVSNASVSDATSSTSSSPVDPENYTSPTTFRDDEGPTTTSYSTEQPSSPSPSSEVSFSSTPQPRTSSSTQLSLDTTIEETTRMQEEGVDQSSEVTTIKISTQPVDKQDADTVTTSSVPETSFFTERVTTTSEITEQRDTTPRDGTIDVRASSPSSPTASSIVTQASTSEQDSEVTVPQVTREQDLAISSRATSSDVPNPPTSTEGYSVTEVGTSVSYATESSTARQTFREDDREVSSTQEIETSPPVPMESKTTMRPEISSVIDEVSTTSEITRHQDTTVRDVSNDVSSPSSSTVSSTLTEASTREQGSETTVPQGIREQETTTFSERIDRNVSRSSTPTEGYSVTEFATTESSTFDLSTHRETIEDEISSIIPKINGSTESTISFSDHTTTSPSRDFGEVSSTQEIESSSTVPVESITTMKPEISFTTEKVTKIPQITEEHYTTADVRISYPSSSTISSSVTEPSISESYTKTSVPQTTKEQNFPTSSEGPDRNVKDTTSSTTDSPITEVTEAFSAADSPTAKDMIEDDRTSTLLPNDYGSTEAPSSEFNTTIITIEKGEVSSPRETESSSPVTPESKTTMSSGIFAVTDRLTTTSGITGQRDTTPADVTVDVSASSPSGSTASSIVTQASTSEQDSKVTVPQVTREQDSTISSEATSSDVPHPPTSTEGYSEPITVDRRASSPSASDSPMETEASTVRSDLNTTVSQVTREQDSSSTQGVDGNISQASTSTEGSPVIEVGTSVSTAASSSTVKETIRNDSGEATTPQEIETSSPVPIESKTTMKPEISSVTERVTTSPQITEERFTSTENVAIDVRASSPSSSTVSSMVTEDSTSGPDLETTVSQVIREQDSTTSSKATSSEVSQPPTSTEGYSVPEIATRTSSTTESSTSRETIRDEVTSSAIPKDYGSTEAPVSSSDYTTTIAPIDAEKSSPPQDVETSYPVSIESITKSADPVSVTTVSQSIFDQNVTTPEERAAKNTSLPTSSTTPFSVSETSTFISTEAPSVTVKDVETTTFFSREDASTESPKSSSPVMITSARPDDEQFTSPVNVLPETSSSDSIPTSTDQILRRNETRTESTTPESDLTTSPSPSIITIPFDSDSVTTQSPTVRETVRIVDITTIVMEENVTSEVPVSSSTSSSQDDGSSVPTSPPTTSIFTTVVSLVTDFVSGVTSGPPFVSNASVSDATSSTSSPIDPENYTSPTTFRDDEGPTTTSYSTEQPSSPYSVISSSTTFQSSSLPSFSPLPLETTTGETIKRKDDAKSSEGTIDISSTASVKEQDADAGTITTSSVSEISPVTERVITAFEITEKEQDTTPRDASIDVSASSPSSPTTSSIVTQASTSEQDSEVTVPQVTREQDSTMSSEATSSHVSQPPTSTEGSPVIEVGTSVSTAASSSTVKETIRDDSGEVTTAQEIETSSPIPIETKTTMKPEISSVTERVTTSPQTTEERFTSTENVAIDVRASSPSSSTVSSMVTEDSTSGPDLETTVSQVIREQDSPIPSEGSDRNISQASTSTEGFSVSEVGTRVSITDATVDVKVSPSSSTVSSIVTEVPTSRSDSETTISSVTEEQGSPISSEGPDENISQSSTSTAGYRVTEVVTRVSIAASSPKSREPVESDEGNVTTPQVIESSSPVPMESKTAISPEISSTTERVITTPQIAEKQDTTSADAIVDVDTSSPSSSTASSIVTQTPTSERDLETTLPQVTSEPDSPKPSEGTDRDISQISTSTEGHRVTAASTSVSTTAEFLTTRETDDGNETSRILPKDFESTEAPVSSSDYTTIPSLDEEKVSSPLEIESSSPSSTASNTTIGSEEANKQDVDADTSTTSSVPEGTSSTERVTTTPLINEKQDTTPEGITVDVRASSPSSSAPSSSVVTEDSVGVSDSESTVPQVTRGQDPTIFPEDVDRNISQSSTSTIGYPVTEIATNLSTTANFSTAKETIRNDETSTNIPKDFGSTELPTSSPDYFTTIASEDAKKISSPQEFESSSHVPIESITRSSESVSEPVTTVSQSIFDQNVTTSEERAAKNTSLPTSSTTPFSVSETSTFISTEAPSVTVKDTVKDVETTTFSSREDASTESPKSSSPVIVTTVGVDEQFSSMDNVSSQTFSTSPSPISTDKILRRNETRTESTIPESDLTTSPSPSIITIPFDSDSVTTQSPIVRETVKIVDITTIIPKENVTSEVPVSSSTSLPTSMPASQDDGSSVSIGGDPTTTKLFPQSTDQTIVPNETIPESTTSVPVPTSPPTTSIFTTVVSLVTDFVSGVTSGPPLVSNASIADATSSTSSSPVDPENYTSPTTFRDDEGPMTTSLSPGKQENYTSPTAFRVEEASTTTSYSTEQPASPSPSSVISFSSTYQPASSSTSSSTPLPLNTTIEETTKDQDDGGDEIEESSCFHNGKVYQSAEQVPRPNPCDFCFCFRGDIICLQQTCPPPVAGCLQTPIDGFCCPRYECPVKIISLNLSTTTPLPFLRTTRRVKGCNVNGEFYYVGQSIKQPNGQCMDCKCEVDGIMKCNPQNCPPQGPLLLRMSRSHLADQFRRKRTAFNSTSS
ncbi:uncharacterized protein LOC141848817 [Brevipalpus obovatus]|uniref:uncharacterized protein LOC141848817 n=1 Tax=Brevipalpus obovatus TaxID=246614 RepID=UPI003D9EB71D